MNCGNVVDPVTEQNRKLQAQGLLNVPPQPKKPKAVANPLAPVPPAPLSCSPEMIAPTATTTNNEIQAA